MHKKFNHLLRVSVLLIACLLLISGCTTNKQDTVPPISTNQQENNQSNLEDDKLPNSVEKEYVVVKDYSNNDTSKQILNDFTDVINEELAEMAGSDDRLRWHGKKLFMIDASVPFEYGSLICGYIIMEGEAYCNLYYFEDSSIKYRTFDSDVWSLNFTVYRGHTIAYGGFLGWHNGKVIMQDKVNVQFANGQTVSNSFSNISFDYNDDSEEVITDGYIAIADGQTWIENIEFIGNNGKVEDDWHSDLFKFTLTYLWKDKPNEIWTVYRYNQMLSKDEMQKLWEQSPVSVFIDGEEIGAEHFLLDESINIEYIWRSNRNSNYNDVRKIKSVSDITIEGIDDKDEVIWIDLDKDDGSSEKCFDNLRLDTPPEEPGNYCLVIIHYGDNVLEHQDIYFSLFFRIV